MQKHSVCKAKILKAFPFGAGFQRAFSIKILVYVKHQSQNWKPTLYLLILPICAEAGGGFGDSDRICLRVILLGNEKHEGAQECQETRYQDCGRDIFDAAFFFCGKPHAINKRGDRDDQKRKEWPHICSGCAVDFVKKRGTGKRTYRGKQGREKEKP